MAEQKQLAWSKLGAHFADADKAREYLEFLRWGNAGPACPHCGGVEPYELKPRADSSRPGRKGLYKCREKECRKQFTVTVGTVFEDSHISLNKWLQAIYLIGASKKGISAHQLHRMMGITYRSAWFMMHRLRYAMNVEPLVKLAGTVEMDETYIGGKRKGKYGRQPADGGRKAAVVALVERKGRVKAMPMERVDGHTLGALVLRHVDQLNTSALITDEAPYYPEKVGRVRRETVNHGRGEWVRDGVHTNTAEGFFSLLKRGIVGTFHHVGKGHLGRYVSEFEFRYNNRKLSDAERPRLIVEGAEGKRLTYKQPAGTSQN
jgi:transposase-like protein